MLGLILVDENIPHLLILIKTSYSYSVDINSIKYVMQQIKKFPFQKILHLNKTEVLLRSRVCKNLSKCKYQPNLHQSLAMTKSNVSTDSTLIFHS